MFEITSTHSVNTFVMEISNSQQKYAMQQSTAIISEKFDILLNNNRGAIHVEFIRNNTAGSNTKRATVEGNFLRMGLTICIDYFL